MRLLVTSSAATAWSCISVLVLIHHLLRIFTDESVLFPDAGSFLCIAHFSVFYDRITTDFMFVYYLLTFVYFQPT